MGNRGRAAGYSDGQSDSQLFGGLAPDRVRAITLNDDAALIDYAKPNVNELRANMVRVEADFSATPIKAKIAVCYDALMGSEFEREHGWHVNLMPEQVLREFPADWESRAVRKQYGNLLLVVPGAADLLVPKRRRNEPRDRAHAAWAERLALL